jgi:phage head maturation protease
LNHEKSPADLYSLARRTHVVGLTRAAKRMTRKTLADALWEQIQAQPDDAIPKPGWADAGSRPAAFTRDNTVTLDRRDAIMRPSTFRDGTVEAVIATGADVRRRDGRGEYIERLSIAGADLSSFRGASVLDAHQQNGVASVLGAVDDVRVEGDALIARIRFSDRPEVAGTVLDVAAGILNSVSVGYEVSTWQDGSDSISGLRTRTATKWTPREVSFVPVPADPRARTRQTDPPPSARAQTNREIRELARRSGVAATIVDDLIDREATLDAARSAILNDMVTRSEVHIRSAHNRSTLDDPENFRRAASDGLYTRVSPSFRPSQEAAQFVGLTLPELARVCLNRSGINTVSMSPATLVTRALGLQTTSDFLQILADTVGRTLRDAYAAALSGIRRLSREQTAPDFRARHRLQLDSTGVLLEVVGEHGEFKSGSFIEGGETYKLATYGKIMGFSRQAIINDDLSAFSDVAAPHSYPTKTYPRADWASRPRYSKRSSSSTSWSAIPAWARSWRTPRTCST